MTQPTSIALGLDFGTESVRALLVDLEGRERGSATVAYRHGQITGVLPGTGEALPPDFALQHPGDWLDDSAAAVRRALEESGLHGEQVVAIGVAFTSCSMLPALRDGTPLCLDPRFEADKFAWPKLWKHHGAKSQTQRINELARQRNEPWLADYGGTIGLEWFFPKVFETLEQAPDIYDAAEVWLEAGDWYVWRLVGTDARDLPRSTCMAGYKGMWSREAGYPSRDFFEELDPRLTGVVDEKMPGRLIGPGQRAGGLCPEMAGALGLPEGVPVSAAVIDAHAGVPGAGVADAGTLVMVMGTSSCHMLNAQAYRPAPGVAGIVQDGILPGYVGYETGQAAVGDAFDWLRRTLGEDGFAKLDAQAAKLPPGSDGVTCLDWFNGCRTPLMDGTLRGGFMGLTLNHGQAHLYRALLEASACGVRWIVEVLQDAGVPVRRLVATGGLPHHNPLLVQIYADVLQQAITVPGSRQGPALGAAILGVLAAGQSVSGFDSSQAAISAMTGSESEDGPKQRVFQPRPDAAAAYDAVYRLYRDQARRVAAPHEAKPADQPEPAGLQ